MNNQMSRDTRKRKIDGRDVIYIPPYKIAQKKMKKSAIDKQSQEYQKLTWEALRKSINGLINKLNTTNIKNIIVELFQENLIRGRGLFCRACIKSQIASPIFTDVISALVAVVNTKLPNVGELVLKRTVVQFKRSYKRGDKHGVIASAKFIAGLVNQEVAHEIIALEVLTVLLENPSDDSVEVAVGFVKECGLILDGLCPKGLGGVFERLRGILCEGEVGKRVQFLIEELFAIRKSKFRDYPSVRHELDLVDSDDQITHEVSLEDEIDPETDLDVFKYDPRFLENEKSYDMLMKDILLDEPSSDEEEEENLSDEDIDHERNVIDETETDMVNLRRTIYMTIMSSLDFEDAGHKLSKINICPGQEMEICRMLIECCSQEKTYRRYYGLLGQRFCQMKRIYQKNFEICFVQQYSMIHKLETDRIRNVANFFAHLLSTGAVSWEILSYNRLTRDDTTSSSRIFIKYLFQNLAEVLGIKELNERLTNPRMESSFESIFPKDTVENVRNSINFFTAIGLGGVSENLRGFLKNMPRVVKQQEASVPSYDTSSTSSSSESEEETRYRQRRRR